MEAPREGDTDSTHMSPGNATAPTVPPPPSVGGGSGRFSAPSVHAAQHHVGAPADATAVPAHRYAAGYTAPSRATSPDATSGSERSLTVGSRCWTVLCSRDSDPDGEWLTHECVLYGPHVTEEGAYRRAGEWLLSEARGWNPASGGSYDTDRGAIDELERRAASCATEKERLAVLQSGTKAIWRQRQRLTGWHTLDCDVVVHASRLCP